MQKGQINLFIIGGIIILLVVFLLLVFQPRSIYTPPSLVKDEIIPVVNECLKSSVSDALLVIGQQGSTQPEKVVTTAAGPVAAFVEDGKDVHPSLETLQQEAAFIATKPFDECIGTLSELPGDITKGKTQISVTFTEGDVFVKASVPLYYKVGAQETLVDEMSVTIPFAFKELYGNVEEAVALLAADPQHLDISGLSALPGTVDIELLTDDIMLVTLQEEDVQLDETPYLYRFAVKVSS
ncbi:hypothetical protein HY639_00655 [Candidatus Woesearchaeota archaeon]|nr:hypothetical protein [Candidatus Woesearchaeota archaeon]